MAWIGSSPLAAVRSGMWGLLLFTAVSWLAIGWSVLRLEPSDVVGTAGAVILFGALTELLRACAGLRTWWLNAGMAVLFAATSVLLLTGREANYTAPVALIGWYLMVRGTVDIAVAVLSRDSDRVWGLLMVVGVLEAGLGFFAASPLARTTDLVVTIVGALGLLRAVADLVTALRIREVRAARAKVSPAPAGRASSLAAYTAGLADYESASARGGPRHRATTSRAPDPAPLLDRAGVAGRGTLSMAGAARWSRPASGIRAGLVPRVGSGPESGAGSTPGIRSGREPDSGSASRIGFGSAPGSRPAGLIGSDALAGSGPASRIGSDAAAGSGPTGLIGSGFAAGSIGSGSGPVPALGAGDGVGSGPNDSMWPGGPVAVLAAAGGGTTADVVAGGVSATGGMAAAGYVAVHGAERPADTFHEEVLRTTADLDTILALAGVTSAGVGARPGGCPEGRVAPEVPDTPEGVELPRAHLNGGLPVAGRRSI